MTIGLRVDARGLLRYVKGLTAVSETSSRMLVSSLNEMASALTREIANNAADELGLDPLKLQNMINVRHATAARPTVEIDTSGLQITPEEEGLFRTLQRGRPGSPLFSSGRGREVFQEGELVKVVTVGDDLVCPICDDIASHNPYTVAEARTQIHHGATIGLNNCRCILVPWVSMRRLPVSFARVGGRRTVGSDVVQRTLGQLAAELKDQAKISIKATRLKR